MARVDDAQVANEPVSLADDGFEESRIAGVVADSGTYFSDDVIYVPLGIDEQIGAPKPGDDVLARDQLISAAHQENEQLHGLFFEAYLTAMAAELIAAQVEFDGFGCRFWPRHMTFVSEIIA